MLLSNLNLLATAPGGVARLRELILTLAVQGKLVPQGPRDEPASALLKKIRAEKDRLIAEGKIKRDKQPGEIAEDEKPFGLPQGWAWVPLQYVGYTQTGTTPDKKNPQMYGGGTPFIKPGDIYPNHVDYENEALSQDGLTDSGRVAPSGSLLMVCIGTIGKSNLINRACSFNQQINSITPLCCSPEYVNLYCRSPYFQGEAWARSSSTTIAILNKGKWEAIPLALPPLTEQSRIVTRVEELMRLCDALKAKGQLEATQHAQLVSTLLATLTDSETPKQLADNWQRIATHFDLLLDRPEAVDALEQTILHLAVRGLLVPQDPQDEPASELLKKIRAEKDKLIAEGKIKRDKPLPPIAEDEQPFVLPKGWEWQRVSDVVEMLNGYAFKSEWFKQTGVRLLRNLNISHGYVDWSQPAAIDTDAAMEFQQFALQAGDIVLSLDRPIISTGLKYAVIREADLPCLLLQRVARLTPDAKLVSADFLALWLQSDLFVGTIDPGRSNGVPHISTKQVAGLAFALAPLAEQSRIVARVAQLRRLCADLRQRLSASQSTQAHLAEALVENVS